jgi:hypothetical protein
MINILVIEITQSKPVKSSAHNKTPLLPDQIKHNAAWVNQKVVLIVFLRRKP